MSSDPDMKNVITHTEFRILPLDELIERRNQGVNTTTEKVKYSEKGIPVIRANNISNGAIDFSDIVFVDEETFAKIKEPCKPKKNDILYTNIGSQFGNAARVNIDFKFTIAWNVLRLQPAQNVDSDFLVYLLNNPASKYYIRSLNSSSTMPFVSGTEIGKVLFSVPSFEQQTNIAQTLRIFDDRIDLLRETNKTLETIAQAIFKSWFVDFDPVRAKQEGREPEGMDADTAALFPDSFEESELGLIPKGWQLVPFGELLYHTTGGDWGSDVPDEKNDTRVAIIRGTDIPDLYSGTNNRVPVRYTSQKKLSTRKLQDGDIVIEISGGSKDQPTGRSLYLTNGIIDQFDCPVEPASFCRLFRPNSKNIGVILGQHLTYIYAQGKTWEYQNQSTGISNFQTAHFLKTELVALPPESLLTVFVETVRPMIDLSHLTHIKQLIDLRNTLLPRLISGQLRLPDAESMVEEAVL